MNNNPTSEKLTFRELVNKHKIEIPIIQRDYAQGREGKADIRTNFLNAILEVVNDKKLELDFVYGSVKNSVLQPLDGQQRLTTLFLLNWFVAIKENQLDTELKGLLTKFTYETRTSSREFCFDLINKGIVYNDKQNISEQIIDSSWFFLSWKRDPTIKSMLTMLDSIQQTFQNGSEVWSKLNNISFHYIELQNFGLSDDLYIKMNARGKPLTDFENFKAKFEQHINKENWENNTEETETFSHQIDTIWTDLFWNYRDKTDNVFDVQLLNFFRTMAIINYTIKAKKDDKFRRNLDLLRGIQTVSFNQYLDLGCYDEDYFKTLKSVLNKLSDKNGLKTFLSDTTYVNEQEIFNGAIQNNLGYAELLKLFAYYQYLASENDIDKGNLQNWLRIVRNLVEAHRLYYDNANTFADSLLFFSKLIPNRNNIVEYFQNTVNPEDKGFPKFIIEEEKTKANLILQNDDWKNAIIEIENYGYFNGQIGFILDWCKDANGIHNINKLKEYAEKAKAIFSNDGLNEFENFLFERALLATGDYLLKKGQNYSFLIGIDRDISWKRLLRDNNEKRTILKQLIDRISISSLVEDLKEIVDNFIDSADWRYHFIKQPVIIGDNGKSRLIRYYSEKDILILNSTTTSGYHKEYYSYSLFLKLKETLKLKDEDYSSERSVNYWKYFGFGQEVQRYYIAFGAHLGLSGQYILSPDYEFDEAKQDKWMKFDTQEMLIEYLKNLNILKS